MTSPFANNPNVGGQLGAHIPDDKQAPRTCDTCGTPSDEWATTPCTRPGPHVTSELVRPRDAA